MYNETVMDHFSNPRNVGELLNADAIGEVGNPACGDMLRIFLKIDLDVITQVRFKAFGYAAAIALSSMLTEMAVGKSLDDALLISKEDVAVAMGVLPPGKID